MISNAPEVIVARKLVQFAFENYVDKNDAESHEMLQAKKTLTNLFNLPRKRTKQPCIEGWTSKYTEQNEGKLATNQQNN